MSAKKTFLIFIGLIPLLSFAKPVLHIQHWQTPNGTPVYFVHTPELPMVEINVVFAAGSSRDGNKPGVAQFTNEMLNQGAKNLTADQIAEGLDKVGAQYNDTVNRDMGIVTLQSLTNPKYLNPALDIFANILTSPTFPQDGFLRTQKQILSAIDQQQQTPDTVAKKEFYITLYGDHPYAHPILGTKQTVTALTASDLTEFYKKYYVAKNALIAIVGAVDRHQAADIANRITNTLAKGEAAPTLPMVPAVTGARLQRVPFPSQQTNILVGQVGINFNDPNYFPLMVENYYLGGAPLTSLLFNEIREKRGLAYNVASTFMPLQARGPFVIMMQTRNDEADQSLKVTEQTLQKFSQNGMTENDLAITKNKIINSFPLTLAGNDAISNNLMTIGFYRLPLDYLDTYRDKVRAVTLTTAKNAFQRHVPLDKLVTVMVGDFKN
jgi:zinc protease